MRWASEICNSPFGSNRQISKTQRIILTLNYFQHLLHIHWNSFLLFIPWVSNALRMKSQLRRFYLVSESGIGYRLDCIVDSLSTGSKVTGGKDGVDHT